MFKDTLETILERTEGSLGALIMGIGGALYERVIFDAQSQRTRRLSGYRVPRFNDVPIAQKRQARAASA